MWWYFNELQRRMIDLLQDRLDLFNLAYDKPSPSLPKGSGSYKGHIGQAEGVQRGLKNTINEADRQYLPSSAGNASMGVL